MAFDNPFANAMQSTTQARTKEYDAGLRSYMLKIYNYMASALALTGIVALFTANSSAMLSLLYTQTGPSGFGYLVMFAPLAFILVMSFGMNRMSVFALQATFWGFAVVMGLSMSSIFLTYTGTSVARMFFITAAAFGSLSLYGYTTKKDLSGWGSFLFMGLIGIIIASVVNIFLQSSALQFAVSVIGVLVFAGLTAYDTQKLKSMYAQVAGNAQMMAKVSIMGALNLYLDFINMFIMLIQLFGDRR